jgi:hypothetical protein
MGRWSPEIDRAEWIDGATDVTESWVSMSDNLLTKVFVPLERRRNLETAMHTTLARLESVAESSGTVAP